MHWLSMVRRCAPAVGVVLAIAVAPGRAAPIPPPSVPDAADAGVRVAGVPGVVAAPIHEWLAAAGIAPGEAGAVALPLDGGPAIVSHDGDRPLNPASTVKLLTTSAALALLGPEYRWRTAFLLRGQLVSGVLLGDLVLRGGGDPKLVIEELREIVASIRAAGIDEIAGDLVIDDSVYEPAIANEADFDGDASQPYNVGPFGALLNFKSVRIAVRPLGDIVELSFDPDLSDVAIDSAIRLVDGPCRYGASALQVYDVVARGAPAIRIGGDYPRACGEQTLFSAVLDHRQYVHALFKAAWQSAGGRWNGRTRVERGAARGEVGYAARGEAGIVWRSPRTLADVVRDVNKLSNNVMARHLLLQLAVESGERPARVETARRVLGDWLRSQQLWTPDTVIDNGAGLSRIARVSASQLARAVRQAAAAPYASVLRESLPIAGIDGTMKRRLVGEAIAGRAWIKTGSLNEVRAIAGYVAAASGKQYAVALIVNGARAWASRTLQDDFLRWVHENG